MSESSPDRPARRGADPDDPSDATPGQASTEPATESGSSQGWQRVSTPAEDTPAATTGSIPAIPVPGRRRRPARALDDDRAKRNRTLMLFAVATVVLVLIAGTIAYLSTRVAPVPETTPTPTPTVATWKLALPQTVGPYSRDAGDGVTPSTSLDGTTTLSAKYSKGGVPSAVIMISRPYLDLKSFAESSNIGGTSPEGDALCGTQNDNALPGCAVIKDGTVVVVFDLVNMPTADLVALAQTVMDAVSP